jgi:hypothetical protein
VLLLRERNILLIQPEVLRHPLLELLHLVEHRGGPLHQLGVRTRPLGEPERDVPQPDVAHGLLGDGHPRPVAHQLVGQHPADVVHHEAEADVFEHRSVHAAQDVLQVGRAVGADLAHVGVEPGLPRAVAQPPGELGEVLRIVELPVEVAPVEPLQPALPAHVAQVSRHLVVVELGPGDEKHLGFDALHFGSPPAQNSAPKQTSRHRHSAKHNCAVTPVRPGTLLPTVTHTGVKSDHRR